jgi:glycosyltransferase involved in cell wall biosynthesis
MLAWESLHSISVGGTAVAVTELSAAMERHGHEVHVFTRMAPGQRYHERVDGVHYHRCPYPAHHDFVDDVNNMCRAIVDRVFTVEDMIGNFDIVHAHDWLAANAMIWIKQGRGPKCVLTIHSTEYARCGNAFPGGRSQRVRDQERAGTYWADKVVCVSNATKNEVMWMYEVPEWKVHAIYNGVSSDRFAKDVDVAAVKHAYGIGPLDPTVLFCGRLEWQKGPDLLVEAIPRVLGGHGNAKFVFAGDGGMRPQLEHRAWQIGAGPSVRFLGFRGGDSLVELYKMADVVCVPSRNEPFGIVILEAWSAEKPVVATDVGGPNEFVHPDFDGYKIAPHPDSIAWGLGALMSDFEKARWMGRNGRRTVLERFSWDVIASHTLGVYGIAPKPLSEEIGDIEGKKKPPVPSPPRRLLRRRTQGTPGTATVGGARAFEEGAARG